MLTNSDPEFMLKAPGLSIELRTIAEKVCNGERISNEDASFGAYQCVSLHLYFLFIFQIDQKKRRWMGVYPRRNDGNDQEIR